MTGMAAICASARSTGPSVARKWMSRIPWRCGNALRLRVHGHAGGPRRLGRESGGDLGSRDRLTCHATGSAGDADTAPRTPRPRGSGWQYARHRHGWGHRAVPASASYFLPAARCQTLRCAGPPASRRARARAIRCGRAAKGVGQGWRCAYPYARSLPCSGAEGCRSAVRGGAAPASRAGTPG